MGKLKPEGGSCPLPGYLSIENDLTSFALPPTPIDDKQTITSPGVIPKPYWGMKTSVIDMALTPELLEHILGTTKRENSTRGK